MESLICIKIIIKIWIGFILLHDSLLLQYLYLKVLGRSYGLRIYRPSNLLKTYDLGCWKGGGVFNKLNRAYIYIYIQLLSDQHTQFIV